MTWNMRSGSAPQYAAALTVSGGRIDDPRLPRPVTDVAGRAAFDSQQLKLQELRGKWGAATVAISMNRTGWSADAPIALSARAAGLPLDDDLYRALAVAGNPQSTHAIRIANVLREQWDKYRPEGIVDAELQATFDGRTWRPQATLSGRELSFASEKFAYRLTHGDGTIRFRSATADGPAVLDVNLGGFGAGQRVSIVAQVIDPRPGAAGWVQITGDDLVIDDHLIAAVDQRIEEASHRTARSVIASLHPAGRFNLVYWRLERPQADAEPLSSMRLDMTDVRINYDGFPYPLQKIRGVIQAQGDHWTFANFASGGRRTILAHGHLLPTEAGSHELWLHFTGQNIPLGDDSLYWALQEPVRDAWKKLQPTGAINVTADVRHRFGQARPQVSVVIEPLANCTLKPQFFSYLMEDVTGTITYTDGAVNLQNMKARHQDGVTMGANGAGTFTEDRGWEFTLSGLWADGVKVRPALMTALPEKLRRLIDTLRPSGSFSLHGSELSFRQPASALAPLEARWDLQLECHQSDIHCGIDVESVSGSVRLQGIANQQQSYSAGELTLETLTYQDVQFTDVTGPMWVDESQCRFGKWATEQTGQPERRLKGRVYGGAMSSNAWVSFGHRPQYGVEAALVGADLNRLIVERFSGQQPYQGKIDATLVLSGEGPLLARLTGEGDVHIREANIYELPLLMSLLKVLRTGAPDKTAFNQSDIAFRIQGPHIYLDTINFLGDVVDLYGYGETGFDQHLKLFFRSELGPREYLLPAVKELVGQASQRIMQLYVDGTLSEPRVTTEAFPQINQMVKQIRNDLENPPPTPGGLQAQRTDVFGRPASR
jgi:hypothetical protein